MGVRVREPLRRGRRRIDKASSGERTGSRGFRKKNGPQRCGPFLFSTNPRDLASSPAGSLERQKRHWSQGRPGKRMVGRDPAAVHTHPVRRRLHGRTRRRRTRRGRRCRARRRTPGQRVVGWDPAAVHTHPVRLPAARTDTAAADRSGRRCRGRRRTPGKRMTGRNPAAVYTHPVRRRLHGRTVQRAAVSAAEWEAVSGRRTPGKRMPGRNPAAVHTHPVGRRHHGRAIRGRRCRPGGGGGGGLGAPPASGWSGGTQPPFTHTQSGAGCTVEHLLQLQP